MTQLNNTIKSNNSKKGTHLTYEEMCKIEAWKIDGHSNREIARRLGRAAQTINNAIKKGTVKQKKQIPQNGKIYTYISYEYFAYTNMQIYQRNRKKCGSRPKWIKCEDFLNWADKKILKDKWSPDACVGHAKLEKVFTEDEIPSTKSLYNWIDAGLLKTKNINLLEKAYRSPRKTKKQHRKNKKILGMSISERPEHINDRKEFGHWEIDTVIGKKSSKDSVLMTLVERKTRFECIIKIDSKTSKAVEEGLSFIEKANHLQSQVFKTITSDNGAEFSSISEVLEHIDIYFCRPYASYERGTSENQHKLIRRFIPKGKSINELSEIQLKRVNVWMNNYPRKILGYRTANEEFFKEVRNIEKNSLAS